MTADQPSSGLVAATSSDSDTEDEVLQSNNSSYDNQAAPCTGNTHTYTHTLGHTYICIYSHNIAYLCIHLDILVMA